MINLGPPRTVRQHAGNNAVLARIRKQVAMPVYVQALQIANSYENIYEGNEAAVKSVVFSCCNPPWREVAKANMLYDINPIEEDGSEWYFDMLRQYVAGAAYGEQNYAQISDMLQIVVRQAMVLRYKCLAILTGSVILLGFDNQNEPVRLLVQQDGAGLKATLMTEQIPEGTAEEAIIVLPSDILPTYVTVTGEPVANECVDLTALLWEIEVNASMYLFRDTQQIVTNHSR